MTHPLTDDICFHLAELWCPDPGERENMRAAADWQLEQDAEFWRLVLVIELGFTQEAAKTSVESFKKAMRPTTTQENT